MVDADADVAEAPVRLLVAIVDRVAVVVLGAVVVRPGGQWWRQSGRKA